MALIQLEHDSHWYTATGEPCHTQADGKPTTLRHARKANLLPSVTTILRIMDKPQIGNWRVEQAILSALTLQRKPNEDIDVFAQRVVEDMDEQLGHARKFGSAIHAAVEQVNRTGNLPPAFSAGMKGTGPDLHPFIGLYKQWLDDNITEVIGAEQVTVNKEYGYAGTMDLVARHKEYGLVVIDFKTQSVRGKPVFYDSWLYQLAAYQRQVPGSKIMSVVINSNKPEPPVEYRWNDAEAEHGWFVFHAALNLWQRVKKYVPNEHL